MIWLLSTEELHRLHGRLVYIRAVTGRLSDRAQCAAAEIEMEIWTRTGKPVDTPLTIIPNGVSSTPPQRNGVPV